MVDPPISLVPVKNGLPKTTANPLALVPDCKGVEIIFPLDWYLFSVLDGKKASKPNSVNFIFSLISTDIKLLVNLKALALNEPLVKFCSAVKLELSCDVWTCNLLFKRSLPAPSKFNLASKSGIESNWSETKKPSLFICLFNLRLVNTDPKSKTEANS